MGVEGLSYIVGPGPEHRQAILDFLLTYFLGEEPINIAAGLTLEEGRPVFEEAVEEGLRDGVSVLALDSDGAVAGVRLSKLAHFDRQRRNKGVPQSHAFDGLARNAQKIMIFLERLEEGLEDIVPVCDCDIALKFIIVCVHPNHYRRGIAGEAMRLSMEAGRLLGATLATVTATAFKSQQLFSRKLGFTSLKVVRHSDYRDQDGSQIFNCADGTTCGILMCKPL